MCNNTTFSRQADTQQYHQNVCSVTQDEFLGNFFFLIHSVRNFLKTFFFDYLKEKKTETGIGNQ